jgi:hypothetical protein
MVAPSAARLDAVTRDALSCRLPPASAGLLRWSAAGTEQVISSWCQHHRDPLAVGAARDLQAGRKAARDPHGATL